MDEKSEDAREFLTTCIDILKNVWLDESHGVGYATFKYPDKRKRMECLFEVFTNWISAKVLEDI